MNSPVARFNWQLVNPFGRSPLGKSKLSRTSYADGVEDNKEEGGERKRRSRERWRERTVVAEDTFGGCEERMERRAMGFYDGNKMKAHACSTYGGIFPFEKGRMVNARLL